MKRLMIFFLLMAWAALSAAGQVSPKTAELGWLELPAFSDDPEHFFVSHYTDEYMKELSRNKEISDNPIANMNKADIGPATI